MTRLGVIDELVVDGLLSRHGRIVSAAPDLPIPDDKDTCALEVATIVGKRETVELEYTQVPTLLKMQVLSAEHAAALESWASFRQTLARGVDDGED